MSTDQTINQVAVSASTFRNKIAKRLGKCALGATDRARSVIVAGSVWSREHFMYEQLDLSIRICKQLGGEGIQSWHDYQSAKTVMFNDTS